MLNTTILQTNKAQQFQCLIFSHATTATTSIPLSQGVSIARLDEISRVFQGVMVELQLPFIRSFWVAGGRSQAEKGATRQRRAQYNRAILPEAVFVESLVKFAISPLACHKRRWFGQSFNNEHERRYRINLDYIYISSFCDKPGNLVPVLYTFIALEIQIAVSCGTLVTHSEKPLGVQGSPAKWCSFFAEQMLKSVWPWPLQQLC